jgi:hypothetical protein
MKLKYGWLWLCGVLLGATTHQRADLAWAQAVGQTQVAPAWEATAYCPQAAVGCASQVKQPSQQRLQPATLASQGQRVRAQDPYAPTVNRRLREGSPSPASVYRQAASRQTDVSQPTAICSRQRCDVGEEKSVSAKTALPRAAVGLAIANAAANSVDTELETPHLLAGQVGQCVIDPNRRIDCCHDRGWGTLAALKRCSKEAQALGAAKVAGLTVALGRYCAAYLFFECVEHRQIYCVFNDTIAYVVQTQGRRDQLQISMGTASQPNCRGLTLAELQQLDFTAMDFAAFYAELQDQEWPSAEALKQRLLQPWPVPS